jgi:hypothetical protein
MADWMTRIAGAGLASAWAIAAAQGGGAPPPARLEEIARLLPGTYDNSGQVRLEAKGAVRPEDRHVRLTTTITRIDAPAFGPYAYLWVNRALAPAGEQASYRIATLEPGRTRDEVVMRHYLRMSGIISNAELVRLAPADLRRTEGCDYVFGRRGEGFRGAQLDRACQFEWEGERVYTANFIDVAPSSLAFIDHKFVIATGRRITGVASGEPFRLDRVGVPAAASRDGR